MDHVYIMVSGLSRIRVETEGPAGPAEYAVRNLRGDLEPKWRVDSKHRVRAGLATTRRHVDQVLAGGTFLGEAALAPVHPDTQGQEADGTEEQEDVVDQEESIRIFHACKHDYDEN